MPAAVPIAIVAGAAISGGVAAYAGGKAADAQRQAYGDAGAAQVEAARIAAESQKETARIAAETQMSTTEIAAQTQKDFYEQGRADLAPYRQAGQVGLTGFNAAEYLQMYPDVAKGYASTPGGRATADDAYRHWQEYGQGEGRFASFKAQEAGQPGSQGLMGMIEAGPGEFKESPGYQFTLSEGLKAQQNALSAMGQNRSGKHIEAATQYAEGLASTEYDNFLKRWYQSLTPYQSLAGVGQTAGGQSGLMAGQTGAGIAGSQMQGGMGAAASIYGGGMGAAQSNLSGGYGAANAMIGAGNAQAGGYINQANALTGALQGGANQYLYYNALRNLQQQQPGGNFPMSLH